MIEGTEVAVVGRTPDALARVVASFCRRLQIMFYADGLLYGHFFYW
jgi:hypothetical protein